MTGLTGSVSQSEAVSSGLDHHHRTFTLNGATMAIGRPLLVLLAVQTALAAAEPVHLPIVRRSTPAVRDSVYYARSAERLRLRYAPTADDVKRANDLSSRAEVPLLNQVSDGCVLTT